NAGERIAHRAADTLYVPRSLDLDGPVERPAWRVGTRLAGVEHGHRGYSNGGREMHRTRVTRHDERAVAQERREVTDAKPRRHEHGTDEIALQPACLPSIFRAGEKDDHRSRPGLDVPDQLEELPMGPAFASTAADDDAHRGIARLETPRAAAGLRAGALGVRQHHLEGPRDRRYAQASEKR